MREEGEKGNRNGPQESAAGSTGAKLIAREYGQGRLNPTTSEEGGRGLASFEMAGPLRFLPR